MNNYTRFFFFLILNFYCIESFAQFFKYKTPEKSEKITIKLLQNGNQHPRWKQVIFKEAKFSKNNSLITDALMVDFGIIKENNKSISLTCTGGFTDANIELFFVGDTDFFSIDIDTIQNVWQKYHETTFYKKALKDLNITIRPKVIEKGSHKAFIAFRIDKQIYRIAIKADTKTKIVNHKEDITLNLGLVEADSTEFTNYHFSNLGELPLEITYSGDSSGFLFQIEGDTLRQDSINNYIPTSDTLTLSFAPVATILGDKYGELILKNNYIEQHIFLSSFVKKIRGEVFWEDTTSTLINNIQIEETKLFSPLDTVWLEAAFYNDSDYDTLYNIDSIFNFNLPKWLKYEIPEKRLNPRSKEKIKIPLTLKKTSDLTKSLNGVVTVIINEDSSSQDYSISYNPEVMLINELRKNIPDELQFSSHQDTFEIKVPYLNTEKNAVYPSVKNFLKEVNVPKDLKVFYGTPRIKPWRKGYISIYITPFDSINFHKEKIDTLSFNVYGQETLTKVELIQEPWEEIIKDYTSEIIYGIIAFILIIVGAFSPKIYKLIKAKYQERQQMIAIKHRKEVFKEIEEFMIENNLEEHSFKEGLLKLKEKLYQ